MCVLLISRLVRRIGMWGNWMGVVTLNDRSRTYFGVFTLSLCFFSFLLLQGILSYYRVWFLSFALKLLEYEERLIYFAMNLNIRLFFCNMNYVCVTSSMVTGPKLLEKIQETLDIIFLREFHFWVSEFVLIVFIFMTRFAILKCLN